MSNTYKTETEWELENELEKANKLKTLILGRGDDGVLSAISGIFDDRLSSVAGKNERVVSVDDFVDYLVQSGFARNSYEAREEVLPKMENQRMNYRVTQNCSWSLRINKVRDGEGNSAYRVSRFIG